MIEFVSMRRGETQMHCIETIGGAAGMRDLTNSEVAIVGGGGAWSEIADAIVDVILVISPTTQSIGNAVFFDINQPNLGLPFPKFS